MESACDQAVATKQWTVALQLLRDGVSPSEWTVNELFQNKAQELLDLFPAGSFPEGLKGLLLMVSIKHGLGDLTLNILEKESVSDSVLMEAIKYAVHLQNKTVFLKMIRGYPKSRRVFKQKFVHEQWKENLPPLPSECEGGEVRWMFDVLYEDGEKDLALFVASSGKGPCSLIGDFCWGERNQTGLKPKLFRYALTKLHELDCKIYCKRVEEMYKASDTSDSNRSCLIRHALQLEEYSLIVDLCSHGVSRNNLQFVISRLVPVEENIGKLLSSICAKLDRKDKNWLQSISVKFAMKTYFKQKSSSSLKIFIDLFKLCCEDMFRFDLFKKVITRCVKLNLADCFHMLFELWETWSSNYIYLREDLFFACTSAITGNRPHFISKVCEEELFGKQVDSKINATMKLIDIMIERNSLHMLVCVSAGVKGLPFVNIAEKCMRKMLLDQSVWPDIATALDQWIKHCTVDVEGFKSQLKRIVKSMNAKIAAGRWSDSMSSLMQWCLDNDHINLAFLLALVTKDLEMLETLVTTSTSLDLPRQLLWSAVVLFAKEIKFSASAAVLKHWPVDGDSVNSLWKRSTDMGIFLRRSLASACEKQGLLRWALVLMTRENGWTFVLRKHHQCQDLPVLNFVFKMALISNVWNVAGALVTKCSDSKLGYALEKAVRHGRLSFAKEVISRVDPTVTHEQWHFDNLLYAATKHIPIASVEMVRLCISAGLSSFQRHYSFCPLFLALNMKNVKCVRLLLSSGAISHKRLLEILERDDVQQKLQSDRRVLQIWKTCYRYIVEAAASPCRLEHLARLAVSRSIGCQPGRADRIGSLPVPEPVKDLVNFKDVVSMDLD